MRYRLVVLFLASAAATGCATHHRMAAPRTFAASGLVREPKKITAIERSMTDTDIANLLDADVRAKLPTGLAVAGFSDRCTSFQGLKTIAGDELAGWEAVAKDQAFLRGVHPVSVLMTERRDVSLQELRSAAANMNCELLLVYLESDDWVENYNDAAALYWTLVGLWLVPGNVYEHRTVYQSILVDSRTGLILGTATGDSHKKRRSPAAYGRIQRDKLARETPREAISDLQTASRKLLRDVVESAAAGAE